MEPLHTLQWLYEMGVDEVVTDAPVNRLSPPKSTTQPPVHTVPKPQQPAAAPPILGSSESIKIAEQVVQHITDLDGLHRTLESFTGCPALKNTAKHTLMYTGNPKPILLCIGDCPTSEDEQNGRLLNEEQTLLYRMVKSIRLKETDIAYAPRTFWYAPGGRTITQGEADTCMPFVKKIIELSQPKHILILGNDTAKTVLQTRENMAKINGKTTHISIANTVYACTPTFGFKSIFDNPKRKHHVWQALKNIRI